MAVDVNVQLARLETKVELILLMLEDNKRDHQKIAKEVDDLRRKFAWAAGVASTVMIAVTFGFNFIKDKLF